MCFSRILFQSPVSLSAVVASELRGEERAGCRHRHGGDLTTHTGTVRLPENVINLAEPNYSLTNRLWWKHVVFMHFSVSCRYTSELVFWAACNSWMSLISMSLFGRMWQWEFFVSIALYSKTMLPTNHLFGVSELKLRLKTLNYNCTVFHWI